MGTVVCYYRQSMDKHTRVIDGQTIVYFAGGAPSGRPLVFVPGVGGDWHGFEPYIELLGKYRLIFVELPGQGGASPRFSDRRHTAENYARIVSGLIEHEGWGDAVLIGHSFGAMVALIAAGLTPATLKS